MTFLHTFIVVKGQPKALQIEKIDLGKRDYMLSNTRIVTRHFIIAMKMWLC